MLRTIRALAFLVPSRLYTVFSLVKRSCWASCNSSVGASFHVRTQRARTIRLLSYAFFTSSASKHRRAASFLMKESTSFILARSNNG